jgi:hypothetical protein
METVCGSLVLCRRYQRGGDAGLDDIALPASWFSELPHVFPILGQLSVALAYKFPEPALELLRLLSSEDFSDEFLLFEGRPLRVWVIRNIFMHRM